MKSFTPILCPLSFTKYIDSSLLLVDWNPTTDGLVHGWEFA